MWDAKSPQPRRSTAGVALRRRAGEYVVRNLGFVAATRERRLGAPAPAPRRGLADGVERALYWLHDQTIERVLISFLDGEWTHELVRSRDEAVRALLARVKFNAPDREATSCSQPRPLHDLPTPVRCAPLLDAWSELRRQVRPRAVAARCCEGRSTAASCCVESAARLAQPVQSRMSAPGFGDVGRVLAVAHQGPARRGPARLRLRQMGRRGLPRGHDQARAESRGRRRRHHLAAAAAHELPLPAPGGAVQERAQLNRAAERDGDRPRRSTCASNPARKPRRSSSSSSASIHARQQRGLPFGAVVRSADPTRGCG